MTHIVREVDRPGSKLNKKEVVESVSVLEAPPMICVGFPWDEKITPGKINSQV